MVAKTCCCLGLFSLVLFGSRTTAFNWICDVSIFLQPLLYYSLLVKLFLQTGLWQFDDIWVQGEVKIWLPKSTVIIVINSYPVVVAIQALYKGISVLLFLCDSTNQKEHERGWARRRQSSGWVPSPCCISALVKAAAKVKLCPANHWCRSI